MSNSYTEVQTEVISDPNTAIFAENPSVSNVEDVFKSINTKGDYLAAWDNWQAEPYPRRRYQWNRFSVARGFKKFKDSNKIHFQGIQRKGNYALISGGDSDVPIAHLFVVRMGSRAEEAGWGSNRVNGNKPPKEDQLVATVGVDRDLWHAGGISLLGDIVAAPIYAKICKIVFYHCGDPEKPRKLNVEIDRQSERAGAVALTKVNDRYLTAVWQDNKKPYYFDFYLSKSKNIFDGFQEAVRIEGDDIIPKLGDNQKYQAVNFVNQADGKLYLIAMHNTGPAAPYEEVGLWPLRAVYKRLQHPDNYADLYEVRLNFQQGTEQTIAGVEIEKKAKKKFVCRDKQANMDAASGVYVDSSGSMRIYSGFHFRRKGLISFNEYSQ
jgi:hypothetical protein